MKPTEIQKVTKRYQDVNKIDVKFRGKIPVNIEYEKKTKNGNSDNRENRYHTPIGHGLDENIQTHKRKNTNDRK